MKRLILATALFLEAALPGAEVLISGADPGRFQIRKGEARLEVVTAAGQPFGRAIRIESSGAVRVAAPIGAALASGDVLFAAFTIRGVRPAAGSEVEVSFEPSGRFCLPLRMPVEAGPEWRKVEYPFWIWQDYRPGQAELVFSLRGPGQAVEIGGIELVNHGKTKRVSDLPCTRLGYAGSEPSAPWRAAADSRIEKIRKGDLKVEVKDGAGAPVANASVTLKMRKHAFGFGTAVSGPVLFSERLPAAEVENYRARVVELFNRAVMENDLKWPQWENRANRPRTVKAVEWLRDSGLDVRGHNLVWPSWRWTQVPAAAAAKNDPGALAKVILDHIADSAGTMRGRVAEWDVINEPFSNHDFMDILGRHAMVDWFHAARKADPGARLYINDYDIFAGNDRAHQDHYYETIRYLLDQGAPLDGIGVQGHFPARVTPPEEVLRRLERFAALGKPIEITEFDIDTNDEQTQAEYTRDFMTLVFSHPSVSGFLMWGFWEGSHWKPKGAMVRHDWSLKPNGQAYKDLVFGKWWTSAAGTTGRDGTWSARGFMGEYDLEVRAGNNVRTAHVKLPKEGARVAVVIE